MMDSVSRISSASSNSFRERQTLSQKPIVESKRLRTRTISNLTFDKIQEEVTLTEENEASVNRNSLEETGEMKHDVYKNNIAEETEEMENNLNRNDIAEETKKIEHNLYKNDITGETKEIENNLYKNDISEETNEIEKNVCKNDITDEAEEIRNNKTIEIKETNHVLETKENNVSQSDMLNQFNYMTENKTAKQNSVYREKDISETVGYSCFKKEPNKDDNITCQTMDSNVPEYDSLSQIQRTRDNTVQSLNTLDRLHDTEGSDKPDYRNLSPINKTEGIEIVDQYDSNQTIDINDNEELELETKTSETNYQSMSEDKITKPVKDIVRNDNHLQDANENEVRDSGREHEIQAKTYGAVSEHCDVISNMNEENTIEACNDQVENEEIKNKPNSLTDFDDNGSMVSKFSKAIISTNNNGRGLTDLNYHTLISTNNNNTNDTDTLTSGDAIDKISRNSSFDGPRRITVNIQNSFENICDERQDQALGSKIFSSDLSGDHFHSVGIQAEVGETSSFISSTTDGFLSRSKSTQTLNLAILDENVSSEERNGDKNWNISCDKSVQTTNPKALKGAKKNSFKSAFNLPRIGKQDSCVSENTIFIRGKKTVKRKPDEIIQEEEERFKRKQIAYDLRRRLKKKILEPVSEDGSIFQLPKYSNIRKTKTPKKRKEKQTFKAPPSPATAMEIQQLMSGTQPTNLLQQEGTTWQYCKKSGKLDLTNGGESEDEAKEDIDIGHYSYIHACEQLENPPIRKIFEQLQTTEISLQYVGLNSNDVIALTYALLHNNRVESLDLEDNRLKEDGLLHVIELLKYNNVISSLSLANNKMTVNCAGMLKETLRSNNWLTHLNLSGSKFGDDGAKHLGLAMRANVSIIWMNLSHNDIGVTGAQHIGRALSINDSLEVLDLSWNHIRRMGALAICKGLQDNNSIVNFNLSWNGFGLEGSLALENVFKENVSLKCIDLSNNRINWDGLVYLARGLKRNNVLRILKLGDNPLPVDGILKILNAVSSHRSHLSHLSLENVPVNSKIMESVNYIAKNRLFTITHGGVLDSNDMFGIKRGRERREDPFTLLIRFIGMMGIRVLDLFRIFESGAHAIVSKENFIRGVKKVGAPLSDREIELVARRLERKGAISYSILANGVRNHMREEKKEDKRQENIEVKKKEHRKNFLKSDLGEVKPPEIKELSMFKTQAGKTFARIMSSSNLSSSRKGSASPTSSRVSLLPKLVDRTSTVEKSTRSVSMEMYRLESARRRRQKRLFSII